MPSNCETKLFGETSYLPFQSSDLVSGQAAACDCPVRPNELDDVVAVIFVNAHAAVAKGQEERVACLFLPKGCYDLRVA